MSVKTDKTTQFSPLLKTIIDIANTKAQHDSSPNVYPQHLLYVIFCVAGSNPLIQAIHSACSKHTNLADLQNALSRSVTSLPSTSAFTGIVQFSQELNKLIEDAEIERKHSNKTVIDVDHIVLAMLRSPHTGAGMYLSYFGINYSRVKASLDEFAKTDTAKTNTACGPTNCGCKNTSRTKKSLKDIAVDTVNQVAQAIPVSIKDAVDSLPSSVKDRINSITTNVTDSVAVVADTAKNISQEAQERLEWAGILDEAIVLSKQKTISVPSAFVEVAASKKNRSNKTFINQIRQETISDIVQSLLKA